VGTLLSAEPLRLVGPVAEPSCAFPCIGELASRGFASPLSIELGKYHVRLAAHPAEREAACRLRFQVFNVELREGLALSWRNGVDQDHFDPVCDHLIVEDRTAGEVVGTYRLQSGITAAQNLGYYSEQEFDFAPYENLRSQILELGRAAIAREHRTSEVLMLLWRGIAQYARTWGLRYLIGCSSLHASDPQNGWSICAQLVEFLAAPSFCTRPTRAFELPQASGETTVEIKVPKLLRTYIAVGARICSAPAWDRAFGTIDFLTMLDLAELSPAARKRFLPESEAESILSEPLCVS
jgi:putative hemolysin